MVPELPEWPSAWEMTDESGASNQQRLTWRDGLQEGYIQPIDPLIQEELETGEAIYHRFQRELVWALCSIDCSRAEIDRKF